MDYDRVVIVMGSMVIPVLLSALNLAIRWLREWHFTAAGDFVYSLVVFDLGAAWFHDEIRNAIANLVMRKYTLYIFLTLFSITLLTWVVFFVRSESIMTNDVRAHRLTPKTVWNKYQWRILALWILASGFYSANMLVFFYR